MKMTIRTVGLAVVFAFAFSGIALACDFGCTPGFWKQPQHYDDWAGGYSPTDLVTDVFGCGPATWNLVTALRIGGGGVNALTRHAVASLLNAAECSCFDGGSPADVIAAYCAAYNSGDPDQIESQKNMFEKDNDQNCNLGGSGRAYGRSW